MSDLTSIHALLTYSDRMNRLVFERAGQLDDAKLSQPIEIGPGTLRRILVHIYNGEFAWLARWQGQIETKWPSETIAPLPTEIMTMLDEVFTRRQQFVSGLTAAHLDAIQPYRDSRGSVFKATLRDMILQGIVHSTHHRAQAVNAIRRLGGDAPEVDYMVSVRQPA